MRPVRNPKLKFILVPVARRAPCLVTPEYERAMRDAKARREAADLTYDYQMQKSRKAAAALGLVPQSSD